MIAAVPSTIDRAPLLPARVAHLIGAAIAEGRWTGGQRLPSEQALAALFGVSRNVVREAISRLRAEGTVESRHGIGAFVRRPVPASVLRFDADMLLDPPTLRSLYELRAILEIESAALAASRRDRTSLAAMDEALGRMVAQEHDLTGGVHADLDFHRAVAGAAKNAYVAKVIDFLSAQIADTILAARARPGVSAADIIHVTIAEHTGIRDAIAAGSAEAARAGMARHIHNAAERMGLALPLGVP